MGNVHAKFQLDPSILKKKFGFSPGLSIMKNLVLTLFSKIIAVSPIKEKLQKLQRSYLARWWTMVSGIFPSWSREKRVWSWSARSAKVNFTRFYPDALDF